MGKNRRKNKACLGLRGLAYNDPINKVRRLKVQNDKALQCQKPDWEDKYEYGLSDW
jgi:hypothetical protein